MCVSERGRRVRMRSGARTSVPGGVSMYVCMAVGHGW